jgi:hypothetical protein
MKGELNNGYTRQMQGAEHEGVQEVEQQGWTTVPRVMMLHTKSTIKSLEREW